MIEGEETTPIKIEAPWMIDKSTTPGAVQFEDMLSWAIALSVSPMLSCRSSLENVQVYNCVCHRLLPKSRDIEEGDHEECVTNVLSEN